MNVIPVIDLMAFCLLLMAFVSTVRSRIFAGSPFYPRFFLCLALLIYVVVSFFNFLEHSGTTNYFDYIEDYLELLFIPLFFTFIFLIKLEDENAKRIRLVQFLNDSQEMAHVGCWERNLRTGENFCTDEVYRVLGCRPGEFEPTMENYLRFVHPDDLEALTRTIHEQAEDDNIQYAEYRIIDRQENIHHIVSQARFDFNADGEPVRVCGILQDVTAQKQSAQELQKSEERFRAIAESSTDAIVTTDENGCIVYWNKAAVKLFGYEQAEAVGQPMTLIMTEEYARREPEGRRALMKEGGSEVFGKVFEGEARRKDGSRFPIDIALSFWVMDELYYFSAIIRDISARKKAENAIRETKTFFENVIRSTLDGIIVSDDKGVITMVNDAIVNTFGYSREELVGNHVAMLTSKEEKDLKRGWEIIHKLRREGQVTGVEDVWKKKDGTRVVVEENLKLLKDGRGQVQAVVGSIRDITERKEIEAEKRKLEQQLNRAEKMETIGTLAGGVAHDLNNILGAIVGYPDLMLQDLAADSSLRKSVLAIKASGERAASIVQDLLTLARRGISLSETVNLNTTIARYLDSQEYNKMHGFHPDVRVETDLASDILNISGSPVHLSKVIMNLVQNAAEAMPGGGKICIVTRNIYLDQPVRGYDRIAEGDFVKLTVSDEGVGISATDLKRIFEPFYTKKVMGRSGTGLGMAVVWGTVKDHRGYIDVDSREGVGTTFSLYFPVTRKPVEESAGPVPVEQYFGRGEKILVVDDVPAQREIAESMLAKLKYDVVSVESGEKAVAWLRDHAADLVVLDMIMDPGMDGLDTYREIVKIYPGQKVIIASGFSESNRVKAAQHLGAGKYLRKPYTLEKIGLAVKAALDKQKP